jgi:hypothetical protein
MFSFIETRLFTKLVLEYLSDEQYGTLQQNLMHNPDAGPMIPGSPEERGGEHSHNRNQANSTGSGRWL